MPLEVSTPEKIDSFYQIFYGQRSLEFDGYLDEIPTIPELQKINKQRISPTRSTLP